MLEKWVILFDDKEQDPKELKEMLLSLYHVKMITVTDEEIDSRRLHSIASDIADNWGTETTKMEKKGMMYAIERFYNEYILKIKYPAKDGT